MAKYGMLIDLSKCVGCSACQIACKVENSVGEGQFLSRHEIIMRGTFPEVTYKYIPTMCNHCENAACLAACPVGAITKQDGLNILDSNTCIGCGACGAACPYGFSMKRSAQAYETYLSNDEIISGCTSSGVETAEAAGAVVPYGNFEETPEDLVLNEGKSQKCNFCKSLRAEGEDPYCVHMCPAGARVWGDLEDDDSEISQLIDENDVSVSHPEYGTKPSVFYIGAY